MLVKEGLTRMTSPTVTPRILTGVPVDIPEAWENSNVAVYLLNLDRIWKPFNHAKLSAKRTAPETRKRPTPPSQMLLPPNPKSVNGRVVCLQMARGMSKTSERGLFDPEGEDGSTFPASAEVAVILFIFLRGIYGR